MKVSFELLTCLRFCYFRDGRNLRNIVIISNDHIRVKKSCLYETYLAKRRIRHGGGAAIVDINRGQYITISLVIISLTPRHNHQGKQNLYFVRQQIYRCSCSPGCSRKKNYERQLVIESRMSYYPTSLPFSVVSMVVPFGRPIRASSDQWKNTFEKK